MSEITQVTIVPADKLIIVNGEALIFDWEPIEENVHAIQYHNDSGHIEYEDASPNTSITSEDYETKVKPYVDLWQVEKNRILEEQRKAEEEYNSVENVRARKLNELNSLFEQAETNGTLESSVGFTIDANERANRDIDGLIKSLEATPEETVLFCAADNSFHEVTLDNLKTMQLEVIEYGQQLYTKKWQYREQINQAQSKEELDKIEIKF